jgi:hypothetical protein
MSRLYRVTFEQVLISAAQDLFQINGASGKMLRILHRNIGATDTTLVTAQSLALRERLLPSSVSNGSGGTTPTIYKTDSGDAAASFTALVNNASKATTTGTAAVLFETGCHIYNGYDDEFDVPPVIGPNQAYVFELLSTVSGTAHFSGSVLVEEIGG